MNVCFMQIRVDGKNKKFGINVIRNYFCSPMITKRHTKQTKKQFSQGEDA